MANVNRRVLPGFSLTLGYTLFYLSILVLLPIIAVFLKAGSLSFAQFWAAVWTDRARAAYLLTFGTSFAAALINLLLGSLIAWVLFLPLSCGPEMPGLLTPFSVSVLPSARPWLDSTRPIAAISCQERWHALSAALMTVSARW